MVKFTNRTQWHFQSGWPRDTSKCQEETNLGAVILPSQNNPNNPNNPPPRPTPAPNPQGKLRYMERAPGADAGTGTVQAQVRSTGTGTEYRYGEYMHVPLAGPGTYTEYWTLHAPYAVLRIVSPYCRLPRYGSEHTIRSTCTFLRYCRDRRYMNGTGGMDKVQRDGRAAQFGLRFLPPNW